MPLENLELTKNKQFHCMLGGSFLDSVQAQVEAKTLGLLVVVLRDWTWFTAAKRVDYKPGGAQSRNLTIHTY